MRQTYDQNQLETELSMLDLETMAALEQRYTWLQSARPNQLPPPAYHVWLLLAGRGFGKTRTGAEDTFWTASQSEQRIAVIGPTSNDVRKTCFEGESGLLSVIPRSLVRSYNRTSLELWLTNNSYFVGYSSEEPERLRGPQHHRAWCEELASWKYPEDTWDMMSFGLRLGAQPNVVVTTTPKPIKLIKELVADPTTVVVTGSSYENMDNLPDSFLRRLRTKYEGTRLGQQELHAKILDDNPWALWNRDDIDKARVRTLFPSTDAALAELGLTRRIVAIDPPVTSGEDADECGITAVASTPEREEGWVLADRSQQGLTPEQWARRAIELCSEVGAQYIVAEVNNGGDLVASVINNIDPTIKVKKVHATRGKVVRAEPVAALYEQGRVHHVGTFDKLEQQMCEFTTDFDKKKMGYSPDRVDSLVWGLTELMGRAIEIPDLAAVQVGRGHRVG